MNTQENQSPRCRPTKVFIVADHPLMRNGMHRLINESGDMTVCGDANQMPAALRQLRRTRPDVLLFDVGQPGCHALPLIQEVHGRFPRLPMLVFCNDSNPTAPQVLLSTGVRGCVCKQDEPEVLLQGLRAISRGEVFLSARFTQLNLAKGCLPMDMVQAVGALGRREQQVLTQLGQGKGSRQIAKTLKISPKTVETHRSALKRKLNLADGERLLRFAAQWVIWRYSIEPQPQDSRCPTASL